MRINATSLNYSSRIMEATGVICGLPLSSTMLTPLNNVLTQIRLNEGK
ncbi:hypothetical protein M115_0442 [Bacteroides fragilis str. 3719 T6]|nr:hypothetical protein M115_0442 [Bacteroides fragilis str. 3719 T6]